MTFAVDVRLRGILDRVASHGSLSQCFDLSDSEDTDVAEASDHLNNGRGPSKMGLVIEKKKADARLKKADEIQRNADAAREEMLDDHFTNNATAAEDEGDSLPFGGKNVFGGKSLMGRRTEPVLPYSGFSQAWHLGVDRAKSEAAQKRQSS